MRVCIAIPGATAVTETFIRAHIERLPFQITTLHGPSGGYSWNAQKLGERYVRNQSHIPRIGLSLLPRFVEFRLRRRFFPPLADKDLVARFLREKSIDVVLAEYGTTGAAITPACQLAGIPLVVHFHGYDASRHDILEIHKDTYPRMFQYAAKVIVVSKAMADKITKLGCPQEKIVLSHYGPAPAFFQVKPDYSSNTILAVGRLTQKKAPHLTILAFKEALQKFPELRLVMVGNGELRGVCLDLIHSLGLEEKVKLIGAAQPEVVREQMTKSFLFVQHSVVADDGDSEGTPVAILEASAAALPVVSTFHAGIPDVIVDGETGFLVEERDVMGMVESIVSMAKDRKKVATMGRRAQAHVAASFSMEKHLSAINQAIIDSH